MSDIIIQATGISKQYTRYENPLQRLLDVFLPNHPPREQFHALHPLDLNIRRGEAVGIVGRNGSGKSTLLQIIAGIVTPTTGTIEARGRISALLELGSGFNPNFTGRENVYFNGALLGLDRATIQARIDDILAFAEIGDFVDQPVRTYSTGMFVRLAFSVAIALEPDIFIVDEALSVGDVYFQQKCFERLRRLRESGTTLLFVSHDSGSVYRFCDRAILLEKGHLLLDGLPKDIIETYEARLIEHRDAISEAGKPLAAPRETAADVHRGNATIERAEMVGPTGSVSAAFASDAQVSLLVAIRFHEAFDDPHVGFKIRSRYGDVVFETTTLGMGVTIGPVVDEELVTLSFSFAASIQEGEYTVTLGVANGGYGEGQFKYQLIYQHGFAAFKVLRNHESIQWAGVANLHPQVTIERTYSAVQPIPIDTAR